MNSRDNIYLASKPRYEILDGLRGVAALLIVAYHLFETYSTGPAGQIINHGYLAVDFFFVLSGFVIGYAYDDRWDRMTVWSFFKRRVIRLHPMVVYGCAYVLFHGMSGSVPSCLPDSLVDADTCLPVVLHHRSHARFVGHTRMGGDQSAERTGVVFAMGVSCQYSLCACHTQVYKTLAHGMCGAFRCDDAASLSQCRLAGSVGKPHG